MSYRKLAPFGIEILDCDQLKGKKLRQLVLDHSLLVIRNFHQLEDEQLVEFATHLSSESGDLTNRLLHWDFGPLMKMGFDANAKNYLFSAEDVPFHWDGAFHREPLFLLFDCQSSSGTGGETLFCNTMSIAGELSSHEMELLKKVELEFYTEKLSHYGGRIRVPLLQTHPVSQRQILRIAEEVNTKLNPVSLEVHSDPSGLYDKILQLALSGRHTYVHQWTRGDLVIVDNFSLVHGRRSLRENISRQFRRIQIL